MIRTAVNILVCVAPCYCTKQVFFLLEKCTREEKPKIECSYLRNMYKVGNSALWEIYIQIFQTESVQDRQRQYITQRYAQHGNTQGRKVFKRGRYSQGFMCLSFVCIHHQRRYHLTVHQLVLLHLCQTPCWLSLSTSQ